jgi:uncharacterized protein (TIGR02594 family)
VEATTVKTRTHNTSTHIICDDDGDYKACSHPSRWQPSFWTIYYEAKQFVGLDEKQNTETIKNITEVNPRHTPWCAAFVNGILKRKGYQTTGSNMADSFLKYGTKVKDPTLGDIVVFSDHVGFFQGFTYINGKKHVAVLGGNQSNRVKVSYYPVYKVRSYRRPMTTEL